MTNERLIEIMKRERLSGAKLAKRMKIHEATLRGMLRGDIRLTAEVFANALEEMGYKLIIAKKEDIV